MGRWLTCFSVRCKDLCGGNSVVVDMILSFTGTVKCTHSSTCNVDADQFLVFIKSLFRFYPLFVHPEAWNFPRKY